MIFIDAMIPFMPSQPRATGLKAGDFGLPVAEFGGNTFGGRLFGDDPPTRNVAVFFNTGMVDSC